MRPLCSAGGPHRPAHDQESLQRCILHWLKSCVGKNPLTATPHDWYVAVARAVRECTVDAWWETSAHRFDTGVKRAYYLSLEFLVGRRLKGGLSSLGLTEVCKQALDDFGIELDRLYECEPDAPLGDGGLARLAACTLDSMANLGIPGLGYGLRYDYGSFRQRLDDGWQVEVPESWLAHGNPWEFERQDIIHTVDFYGHAETPTADGRSVWHGGRRVLATAFDTPVIGWQGRWVNTLRLWSAVPLNVLDLAAFNRGDYAAAFDEHEMARGLTRLLYRSDNGPVEREMRLKQEHFFVSASVQDILRRHLGFHRNLSGLPDTAAIQLNDSPCALAIAEMMRLLVDRHDIGWSEAWRLTGETFAYTSHTLLDEAQERWPLSLLGRVLPRHLQIIQRLDADLAARTSIGMPPGIGTQRLIDCQAEEPEVRMGHLGFAGSHAVNGVSAMQTELLKSEQFPELSAAFPGRVACITNGITPRRWLYDCNRPLARLISSAIGDQWIGDLTRLEELEPFAADAGFRADYDGAKRQTKEELASYVKRVSDVTIDPDALFDVQIKPIHRHKRQLMNLLHTVALYQAMRQDPGGDWQPRVKIFAGKAPPQNPAAKLIIKLANDIARLVNADHRVADLLKVVYLPDYSVTVAEHVIPAAELSEQISTPGTEASGTGNMKMALNGALILGSLDGATLEIRDRIGAENMFLFGPDAATVTARRAAGEVDGRAAIRSDETLRGAIEMINSGTFSREERDRYRAFMASLWTDDLFFVAGHFRDYCNTQNAVPLRYAQPAAWQRAAILSIARVGWFSADRAVDQYKHEIWRADTPNFAAVAE